VETRRKENLLDNETRLPELMAILLPDMPEEDNQVALERVRTYITSANAEINQALVDSPWGRRRLAYTIRHEGVDYRDGFYTLVHFSATPNVISEIERDLKLDTNVIRYLLVTHDPKAGEKVTEAPEGAEAAAGTETPAAEAAPAQAETTEAVTAEVPATEAAPAEETAPAAAVEETAETIEGEEEPAPADGPEADDKEA
jgi:small subunit ribosomal protein S6